MPVPAVGAEARLGLVHVEFERIEAERADLPGAFGVGLGGEVASGVAIAVEADPIPELPAEQAVHRHPERLARQIPERDLNAGHRRDGYTRQRAVEEPGAPHLFKEHIDVGRTLAENVALERMPQLRASFAAMDALAIPDQSFIGVDPHVGRVTVSLDLRGPHIGDFQPSPPLYDLVAHQGIEWRKPTTGGAMQA